MPISFFRLTLRMLASGLLVLLTFASAKAQEAPLDPNQTDIPLPAAEPADLQGVNQLAQPEIDSYHCQPAPGTWYPPVYYPDPSLCCPTGVVHRDWFREKTCGFFAGKRQRMLEKDYQWAVQNGHQPVCCPPHSSWGHACDCESYCAPYDCQHCNDQSGCLDGHTSAVEVLSVDGVLTEPEVASFEGVEIAGEILLLGGEEPASDILLVGGEAPASGGFAVETAGYHCVSDGCVNGSNGHCPSWCDGDGYGYGSGYGHGHYCPLNRRHCFHGYYGQDDCEECDDDCHCPLCCLKRCWCDGFCCLNDGLYGDGNGRWKREIPPYGFYHLAYPVNPYHFDERDGRIYAAQGYGHPVGVPLAPNVEHTYNYGWGIPSSRLSPVSRMPGAPGVANPAGVAGPGILPPATPFGGPGGLLNLPR